MRNNQDAIKQRNNLLSVSYIAMVVGVASLNVIIDSARNCLLLVGWFGLLSGMQESNVLDHCREDTCSESKFVDILKSAPL